MKKVSLSGSLRENVGKKDAKMHRKEFKVPCVMYGGKEQVHFVADEKPLMKGSVYRQVLQALGKAVTKRSQSGARQRG